VFAECQVEKDTESRVEKEGQYLDTLVECFDMALTVAKKGPKVYAKYLLKEAGVLELLRKIDPK
jgi:hypothetical protein